MSTCRLLGAVMALAVPLSTIALADDTCSARSETLSPASSSLETAATAAVFCNDPYAVVCAPADQARLDQLMNRDLNELSRRAAGAVAAGAGITPPTLAALNALRKTDLPRWRAAFHEYQRALEHEFFAATGTTPESLRAYFEMVRGLELEALEARPFPEPTKSAMREALRRARLVLPSEIFDDTRSSGFGGCRASGLDINAIAHPDRGYIVFCPATLLSGHHYGDPRSFPDPFASSFETLAHELGHFVDAESFRAALQPFERCLFDVAGVRPWVRPTRPERALGRGQPRFDADTLDELSADAWSAATIALHIRSLSRPAALEFLRESYNSYCTNRTNWGQDEHMPDRPRAEFLLGQNPSIRQQLGCGAPTAAQPACDIAGAAAAPF